MNTDEIKIGTIKKWLGSGSINIFGMPFSGKDTQCQRIADLFDAVTFGGGDILRNSEVSAHLKAEIDRGMLAPTDEFLATILPYFKRAEFVGKPLVLSSVGRWEGEETSVFTAVAESNHDMKAAIFLDLKETEAFARLQAANRGRADDDEEKLHTRFEEFRTKTVPVLNVYKNKGLLTTINGMQTPDQVTAAIITELYARATA